MLTLNNIEKIYSEKTDGRVHALKGITLNFRKCEFVSILGPSGCGKTTLLNIIGGLDRYSNGDLIINNKSTKEFKDHDWDTYRNHSIGFVFQSYNLIPHQTILENVELTLTLGGMSREERRRRAKEALIAVGLEEKINKKPNELSGGQMQRVSIARAIVGEPDIILADEPTGALDTETSKSIMKLLKEISKTKLVIMVTHNPELADEYSDRIIKMLDGKVLEDTLPYVIDESVTKQNVENDDKIKYKKKNSSMSFFTALRLSGKNLLSKIRRTIITCLASSIGIIGIAVILSVSGGMQTYIDKTMLDSAAFNFISINSTYTDINAFIPSIGGDKDKFEEYPENTTGIYPYETQKIEVKKQTLSKDFIKYLEEETNGKIIDISYTYNINLNILTKKNDEFIKVSSGRWNECLNNTKYLEERYTVLAKDPNYNAIPNEANEIALVVDSYNRLSTDVLNSLGIAYNENLDEIKYKDLIGKEYRVVFNDGWYKKESDEKFNAPIDSDYSNVYNNENGITVKIVSVLRQKEELSESWLSNGIAYSPKLTNLVLSENKKSQVAQAQASNLERNVTTGMKFNSNNAKNDYDSILERLGYTQDPTGITIYPKDVNNKNDILTLIDSWNLENSDSSIYYVDMSSVVSSMLGTIVNIITYVLIAFSAVSLVISSIMIAIIIYASVIERTKEIGVLRAIGARKKDVSRVFEAEAFLLGLISGIIAILITLLINIGINAILDNLVGVNTIANLSLGTALSLITLSVILLLIASLIPSRMASKKEPATALRTE